MNPTETIREARRKIDDWVRTRPPALHFQREYDLPEDRDRLPPMAVEYLDNAFPVWRRMPFPSSFGPATSRDAQKLDAAFFDGRRLALLDAADQLLDGVLKPGLPANLQCAALTARAYGRVQFLLWHLHLGAHPTLPAVVWQATGDLAKGASQLLREALAEEEWIDTVIRQEFVLGWADLASGNIDQANYHFLFVIGWYATAEQLGYREVVRDRWSDWVHALYAILDHGAQQSQEIWKATASALLKDLRIGHHRVKPPFVASRSSSGTEGKILSVEFNASFAGIEWAQAASNLGDVSALLDLIVTDDFLHVRLYRRQTTRHIRNRLVAAPRPGPQGEPPRGYSLITPASAVIEPIVRAAANATLDYWNLSEAHQRLHLAHLDLYQKYYLKDADIPQDAGSPEHRSENVRWLSHHQTMRVHSTEDGWTWNFEWKPGFLTFEDSLWKTVYEAVYPEAVAMCEKEGVRHLIISPDGSLSAFPHHLLRDSQGTRLGAKFSISYSPNLTGILTTLDVDKFDVGSARFVIVQDPTETVGLARWECERVATVSGSPGQITKVKDLTIAQIKKEWEGAGVLHFTGHAMFNWLNPDDAFLRIASNVRMGLADLRELRFQRGALVFLSACDTGRHGMGATRSTSRGIVSSLLEAGAATVICALWPIHSCAAALVAHWFYQSWISERKGRLESLQEATRKLRDARRSECEGILGRRVYLRGERPFEDEYYWGAFVLYGAW